MKKTIIFALIGLFLISTALSLTNPIVVTPNGGEIYNGIAENIYIEFNSSSSDIANYTFSFSNNSGSSWQSIETVPSVAIFSSNETVIFLAGQGGSYSYNDGSALYFKPNENAVIKSIWSRSEETYPLIVEELDTGQIIGVSEQGNGIGISHPCAYKGKYWNFTYPIKVFENVTYKVTGSIFRRPSDLWVNNVTLNPYLIRINGYKGCAYFYGSNQEPLDIGVYRWNSTGQSLNDLETYRVRVYADDGISPQSDTSDDDFHINFKPQIVPNLTQPVGAYMMNKSIWNDVVELTWIDANDPNDYHYELEYWNQVPPVLGGGSGYVNFANISKGTNSYSFNVSDLIDFDRYFFRIKAVEDFETGYLAPNVLETDYNAQFENNRWFNDETVINPNPPSEAYIDTPERHFDQTILNITFNSSITERMTPVNYSVYFSNDSGSSWTLLSNSRGETFESYMVDEPTGSDVTGYRLAYTGGNQNDCQISGSGFPKWVYFTPTKDFYLTKILSFYRSSAGGGVPYVNVYNETANIVATGIKQNPQYPASKDLNNESYNVYSLRGFKAVFNETERTILKAGHQYYIESLDVQFCHYYTPINYKGDDMWNIGHNSAGGGTPIGFNVEGLNVDKFKYELNVTGLSHLFTYKLMVVADDGNWSTVSISEDFEIYPNYPPNITSIQIFNQTAVETDTLVGECIIDDDGLISPYLITYNWFKNGNSLGVNSDTLNPTYTDKYDTITFKCSVFDGQWTTEQNTSVFIYGLRPFTSEHQQTDVVGVVVDFLVEYGLKMIAFAGLIALIGLGIWMLDRMGQ